MDYDNLLLWIYEQLDEHGNRPEEGSALAYWLGYRDALSCAILTLYRAKGALTEREVRTFVEERRPRDPAEATRPACRADAEENDQRTRS